MDSVLGDFCVANEEYFQTRETKKNVVQTNIGNIGERNIQGPRRFTFIAKSLNQYFISNRPMTIYFNANSIHYLSWRHDVVNIDMQLLFAVEWLRSSTSK